jgi:hypothetical protein
MNEHTSRMQKSAFAELHGITPGRISQLITAGKIAADDHGVLLDHYKTREWLQSRALRKQSVEAAAEAGDIPRESTADLQSLIDTAQMPIADRLDAQRVLRDIELKETRRAQLEQKMRAEAGTLIEREYIAGVFASFSAALKTHVLLVPQRVAAQVTALARSEGPHAVQERLADELERGITTAIEELLNRD